MAIKSREIPDAGTFRNDVATALIGEEVRITVLRDGKKQDFLVQVGSQEEQKKVLAASLKERFGIAVRRLTSKEIEKYGLESDQGVAVEEVSSKGPFGKIGFRAGDLILQIDDEWVDDPEELAAMLANLPSREKVSLLAIDHKSGKTGYLTLVAVISEPF